MYQFINSKNEEGDDVLVNLCLVARITEIESGYKLSMVGGSYYVDKDNHVVRSIIESLEH